MKRRAFVQRAMGAGLLVTPGTAAVATMGQAAPARAAGPVDAAAAVLARNGAAERAAWVAIAQRLADPVLTNLAAGTLKRTMPVEQVAGANRERVSHLEALGRLLAGLAPWLALAADETPEGRLRGRYADLARRAIAQAVDPASPDALNFTTDRQPLVDAAFLAHAVVRAPRTLGEALDPAVRARLVAALESTRVITPAFSNWLLFSAMVEAGLAKLGARWDRTRVDYALRQHAQWYVGDGHYGDGPDFHWDYYNSYVIQPMLLDVLDTVGSDNQAWTAMVAPVRDRARRYAAVQERLVGPDGSFPPIGRSIAYRVGAFQLLAQMALRQELPEGVAAGQVRGALSAVVARTLEAAGTFDAGRLAADRPRRPPAGGRRALHLDRQPLSVRHGAAAAGATPGGPLLGRSRRGRGRPGGPGPARRSASTTRSDRAIGADTCPFRAEVEAG